MSGARRDHFDALTSLRFLAALLVLLFHFPPQGAGWAVLAGEGHVGVNVFFVLSGFLITARYAEGFARHELSLRLYFVRRAARILPLYYTVFLLSHVMSPGHADFLERWPEWTLTHALFGESLEEFVIPTSWSLTVEECFYASAPLVYLLIAAARRRWPGSPLAAGAAALALVTLVLIAAGVTSWAVLDGRGPTFLSEPGALAIHTIFGRFVDFASGAFAALLMGQRRPSVERVLSSPALAATASVLAAAGIWLAQLGMHAAGGIHGPRWDLIWLYALPLAPATALLILSLTSGVNPVARALSIPPLVYLGKVSYAVYIVQLTPLGRGIWYRFASQEDGNVAVLVIVAGITAVSAVLYEVVEEPARKLVLRLARDPQARRERGSARGRRVAVAALAASIVVAAGAWTVSRADDRHGPLTLAEVMEAGVPSAHIHAVREPQHRPGRDVMLAPLPESWREGWAEDLRAPHDLLVFADGAPLPFTRQDPGRGPAAFYRGPRSGQVTVRLERAPEEITLVRLAPAVAARLYLVRVFRDPGIAMAPVLLVVGVAAAAWLARAAVIARKNSSAISS